MPSLWRWRIKYCGVWSLCHPCWSQNSWLNFVVESFNPSGWIVQRSRCLVVMTMSFLWGKKWWTSSCGDFAIRRTCRCRVEEGRVWARPKRETGQLNELRRCWWTTCLFASFASQSRRKPKLESGYRWRFSTDHPSILASAGKFIKVSLITDANTDEGTSFGASDLITEEDAYNSLVNYRASNAYNIDPSIARKLLDSYLTDGPQPLYNIPKLNQFPTNGLQCRRGCAIAGDIVMIAQ